MAAFFDFFKQLAPTKWQIGVMCFFVIGSGSITTLRMSASPQSKQAQKEFSANGGVVRGTGDSSLWRGEHDLDEYLRFYSDGTVIGVHSSGTPADIEPWFKLSSSMSPGIGRGKYSINGSSIHFSLTYPQGTVVWDGAVQGDSLQLSNHGHEDSYGLLVPGSVETLPVLRGAVCKVDVANKTFRVMPREGTTWKKDSAIVLVWNDQTKLVSGTNTLTMAQFIAGNAFDGTSSDVAAMLGERGRFYIETVGGKQVVRMVEMMVAFDGESSSAPAMVGGSGARAIGALSAGKVSCDDGNH
ncbi:MAG: hypothetical protein ABSF98_00565 [Bryobacteraceae bacterium]|jgi:hypothetical protein